MEDIKSELVLPLPSRIVKALEAVVGGGGLGGGVGEGGVREEGEGLGEGWGWGEEG